MQSELSDTKLFLYEEDSNELPLKAERLFRHQLDNWKLAADGYKSLYTIQIRDFEFDGFKIEAHFNPGRIISSSAKVDAKSISERPCFLCLKNLPPDQKAVKIVNDYILLVNPFPIFDKHFTVPLTHHTPQAIEPELENFFAVARLLGSGFSVFYNGPKCGASAPDHMHFQAGNFGFMRIDHEYSFLIQSKGRIIHSENDLVTYAVTGALRNFISVESGDPAKLKNEALRILKLLKGESAEEPMVNLICHYSGSWRLIIFPRGKHRPGFFFEEGEKKILLSPAAVDMGGVLIFPREEDFNKITKDLILQAFGEVTLPDEQFNLITDKLKIV